VGSEATVVCAVSTELEDDRVRRWSPWPVSICHLMDPIIFLSPYRNRLGIPTCSATRALQSNTPCSLSCTVSARRLPKHPQTTFTIYVHFRSRSTHTVNMRGTHPLDHTRVARHGIHMPTGLRPLSNIQVTWHQMRVFDYIICYVVVDLFYCLLSAEWQQCRNVHTFQASTMNPNNVYTTKSADLEHNACGYNQRC